MPRDIFVGAKLVINYGSVLKQGYQIFSNAYLELRNYKQCKFFVQLDTSIFGE